MKKLYLLVLFVFAAILSHAQENPEPDAEKKQQDIQALKAAFITKELELTPDEAQKFWPVYNQYEKELYDVLKKNKLEEIDEPDKEQKILDVKKKYKDQFTRVLGNQQRMNRLFTAEGKFRKILIRTLQQRQMKRALKRPGLRN